MTLLEWKRRLHTAHVLVTMAQEFPLACGRQAIDLGTITIA